MSLFSKITEREKGFLVIGGIIVLVIIIYHGYSWYDESKKRADDFSHARLVMVERQLNRIAKKDEIEKNLYELKQELDSLEKTILQGDKPPIAAAALSRILREASATQGINIAMERTLNPSDLDHYVAVPVEIGFTTSTEKLKELLYRLRSSPFLLTVSEVKIRVINIANPTDIYTSLIVTGYIKKQEEPVKDEKGEVKEEEIKNET